MRGSRFILALLLTVFLTWTFLTGGQADTSQHRITAIAVSNGTVVASFGNLASGTLYRVERRFDMGSNQWQAIGAFVASQVQTNWSDVPGSGQSKAFYRFRLSYPVATNASTSTLCAEEDNVNVALSGQVKAFSIEATHPMYAVSNSDCSANFSNCPPPETGYPFTPLVAKLFDDGVTVVEAVRESEWWRPNGMLASVDTGPAVTNMHYIRLYRKIADANEWPQFFVLYMDGNLRLIPHPPQGLSYVCFGSSVIVGPAVVTNRPIAEISAVRYVSSSNAVEVMYAGGGTATLDVSEVTRTNARVRVSVGYPTTVPFATFRSMYVEDGNADSDHVEWQSFSGTTNTAPILTYPGGEATEWFFYRSTASVHNTTAPDIRISIDQL
ncbi:MAG TPA: hypothetical protein VL486_08795 [Verrucomicrobiae bacterium]|nr:hypothetical protein [Verrucomicrobiae bacterium]